MNIKHLSWSAIISFGLVGPLVANEEPTTWIRPSTEGLEPNSLNGFVQLTFGYSDNVALATDTALFYVGEQGASFAQVTIGGIYWVPITESLRGGVAFSGSYRKYSSEAGGEVITDDLAWYSIGAAHLELFLERVIQTQFGPMTITPSYALRFEDGGSNVEALGIISQQFAIDARLEISQQVELSFGALVTNDNFDVVFTGIPTRERDGHYFEAYLGATVPVLNFAPVYVEVAYQKNNAEGSDWSWDGIELRLKRNWLFADNIGGHFSLDYGWRDYDTLAFTDLDAGGRGDEKVLRASFGADYRFDDQRRIGAYISYVDAKFDNPAFSADRVEFGVSYSARF